jgi:hypothetical protein
MSDDESSTPIPASAWIFPTLIHGVLALAVCTRLTVGGSSRAQVFADYNVRLPAATEAFVTVATRLESSHVLMMIVLAIALAIDGLVLWLLGGWRRFEGMAWFFTVIVLLLIIWGLMEGSFFMADYKLHEALSRRTPVRTP